MSRRPFRGRSSPWTKWRSEFRSFSNGDSVWPRYSQNTLEVSFFSLGFRVFDNLRNWLENCQKVHFVTVFYYHPSEKNRISVIFGISVWQTQWLQQHVLIVELKLQPWFCGALKKLSQKLYQGHFVADLNYHLDEKSESERERFLPIPLFHARRPKFRPQG